MNQASDLMIRLTHSALTGVPLPEEKKTGVSEAVLSQLYSTAKAHSLTHLVAHGLHENGLLDQKTELGNQFMQDNLMSVLRNERMKRETGRLYRAFEEHAIRFLPLKGAVLRDYYPESWMRTSCDVDILILPEDLDRALALLCEKLKYTFKSRDSYDVSLYSPGKMHLELHFALMEKRFEASGYLDQVWKHAHPVQPGKYQYVMTDDMFYFHQVSHLAKHFVTSGCGVRLFLDLWVLNNHPGFSLDGSYVEYLEDVGLAKLEEGARALSEVWFSGNAHTHLTEQMQTYVMESGIYGSVKHAAVTGQLKTGGKGSYALSRIFLPYSRLSEYYPVLKEKKHLVPYYQLKRWQSILQEGRVGKSVRELTVGAKTSTAEKDMVGEMMRNLHLVNEPATPARRR